MSVPYRGIERVESKGGARRAIAVRKPTSRTGYSLRVGGAVAAVTTAGVAVPWAYKPAVFVVAWVALFVWYRWQQRSGASRLARNEEAAVLLGAHRLDEAAAILDLEVTKTGGSPAFQMLAVFNLGVVELLRGDFDRALAHFAAAEGSGWMRKPPLSHYAPLLHQNRAFIYALVGDLERADPLVDKVAALIGPIRAERLTGLRAMILLRRGRYQACAEFLAEHMLDAGGVTTLHGFRLTRIYQAFALAHLPDTPDREEAVRLELAAARPFRPGEFDYIGAHWPEMREFLVRHRLSDAASLAPPALDA